MRKSTIEKLKNYPNLKKYARFFEKTEGDSEEEGFLPFVVIWFRQLFEKAGIDDGQVPMLFGYDEESDEAQDFWSWGHNSRYNHNFSNWVLADIDFAVDVALQIIDNNPKLKGFDADVEKRVKKEKEEEEKAFKKFMEDK